MPVTTMGWVAVSCALERGAEIHARIHGGEQNTLVTGGLAAWQSWGPRWNHRHGGLSQVAVGRYPKGSVDAGVALAGSDSLVAVGDVDPRSVGAREALEDERWRAAVGIWPYAGLPSRPVRRAQDQHQPISAKTTLSGGWTQSFHRLGPDKMRWSLRKVFFVHNIR